MYSSMALAEHVARIAAEGSPSETRDVSLRLILDLIGAAAAGTSSKGAVASRTSTPFLFGTGEAPVWFTGLKSTGVGAVLCNATAACALDADDGHRAARGHPGGAVVTTALTLAAVHRSNASDLIASIVAGYDVGVRVAASQNPAGVRTHQSGRWAAFASAAAAAALFRYEPAVISQALSIAGVLAPNQRANGSSGYSRITGNDVKEGIGWSSVTGLAALELARHGHSGPLDLLDHSGFYDVARLLSGLGSTWEILGLYLKPYGCCRYIHPALDRIADLTSRNQIDPSAVISIDVETFEWARKLGNKIEPENLVDVQYSLPYCLAVALIDGPEALLPLRRTCLGRPDLSQLASKVTITVRKDIDDLFPAETLAKVTVQTNQTRLVSELGGPLGDPRQPMQWRDVEAKFRVLTAGTITPCKQQRLIDSVFALASGEIAPLLAEVQTMDPA